MDERNYKEMVKGRPANHPAEIAFRRGFQHGLQLAQDLVADSESLRQARSMIDKAALQAALMRNSRRRLPGYLDVLKRRLLAPSRNRLTRAEAATWTIDPETEIEADLVEALRAELADVVSYTLTAGAVGGCTLKARNP